MGKQHAAQDRLPKRFTRSMVSRKSETATRAASTSTSASTGFLSLSPELRNEIYSMCLHNDNPINVQYNKPTYAHRATRWSKLFNPNLLATCRAIYAEATPVLYGSNTFLFGHSSTMRPMDCKKFFAPRQHGPHQYIRHIELHRVPTEQRRQILAELGDCADLQSLYLGWEFLGRRLTLASAANLLMPMIKSWQRPSGKTDVGAILKPLESWAGVPSGELVMERLTSMLEQFLYLS